MTQRLTVFALIVASTGLAGVLGCNSSTSSDENQEELASRHCTEPENPYEQGSGHYAGYEWAERNDPASCGGRSQSFIEGCEEYQNQESEYEDCESQIKK